MTTDTGARQDPIDFLHRHVLSDYLRKWVFLGLLVGVAAGVGAIIFSLLIQGTTWVFLEQLVGLKPPLPAGEGDAVVAPIGHRWLIPLVVAVGGLVSGVFVYWLAPEAAGDGPAILAFHQQGGRIRARVPAVKVIGAALLIGSGNSVGPEGPAAQMVAGFGSWVSDVFRLSTQDRRTALAVGLGAGIGAIFKAPLAGAIMGAELLYVRDFEIEALIPGFIASVIGYTIFAAYAGWEPFFGSGLGLRFSHPGQLGWFAMLGVVCGLIGILNVRIYFGVHEVFHRIHMPRSLKPAVGGLLVGCIAYFYPQIMSTGYGWLQLAINGNTQALALSTIIIILFVKIVTTGLAVGSGGAGGIFAPNFFIGGMVGAAMWGLLHKLPGVPPTPAPFVIVGMAAMFGGIAKAPIAVILMVAEMTSEFSMVIPAMLAVTLAYLVTGDTRIYDSQVETRDKSPAHRGEYIIPLIQAVSVADAMRTSVDTASPGESIDDTLERLTKVGRRGLPVLENGRLVGMFTLSDGLRAQRKSKTKVGDVMSSELRLAHPSDSLHNALRRMTEAGISRMPVVSRDEVDQLLGIISTRDIALSLDAQFAQVTSNTNAVSSDRSTDLLANIPVREAMTRQFDSFSLTTSAREILDNLTAAGTHAALLVDEAGLLRGVVTELDLENALTAAKGTTLQADYVASKMLIVARPNQTIAEALAQPGSSGLRQLPVVETTGDGVKPIGLLRRTDVLSAYLKARDRQATLARQRNRVSNDDSDLVGIDFAVREKDSLHGHTLSDLALPQEAVVTSIIRQGRPLVPRGALMLMAGDQLRITTVGRARAAVMAQLSGEPPAGIEPN